MSGQRKTLVSNLSNLKCRSLCQTLTSWLHLLMFLLRDFRLQVFTLSRCFFHHSTPWICALQRSSKTPTVELLSTLLVCRIIGSMESDESWQSLRSWRQRCNSSSVMPRVTVRQRQYSTCIQRLKLSKLSSRESAKISKVYWIIVFF